MSELVQADREYEWREPTGPLYYVKFTDATGNALHENDTGNLFTLAFYSTEFDDALLGEVGSNGQPLYSEYDMLFKAGTECLKLGNFKPGEDNAMTLVLDLGIDRGELLEGLQYIKKWLTHHRELPLTGKWRDFLTGTGIISMRCGPTLRFCRLYNSVLSVHSHANIWAMLG